MTIICANSDESIGAVIGAINTRPIEDGEWMQICPWGDHPNPAGTQRVTPQAGAAMVTAFNSLLGRAARMFRGLPIYQGHPDVDPKTYPDQRRIGRIDALEARNDGLWGKVAWNALGKENMQEGYYVYPSAVWACRRIGAGVIEPTELLSVGLTNTPNIRSVQPWARNDATPTPADPARATALQDQLVRQRRPDSLRDLYG